MLWTSRATPQTPLSLPTLRDRADFPSCGVVASLLGHYPTAAAPPCLRGNLPRSRPRRVLRQAPGHQGFTKVTFTLHYAPHSRPNERHGIPSPAAARSQGCKLMRLTKLKIAGFKSFVDPTTVTFPSSLTGVVGPNGCGKSNIIDAVRWVMGEISPNHLRAASMADVIFNGSASRKPLGNASVELVFDNSDGKIGGPYPNHNGVALKRPVSRDGTPR